MSTSGIRRAAVVWCLGAVLGFGAASCSTDRGAPPTPPSGNVAVGVPAATASAAVVEAPPPEAIATEPFTAWHADPLLNPGEPAPPVDELPHYRIEQSIDDVTGQFAGTVEIAFDNPTPAALAELPLLLHPNASVELGVDAASAGRLEVKSVERIEGAQRTAAKVTVARPTLVKVALQPSVDPGKPVRLVVRYEGMLRKLPESANDLFSQALGSLGTLTSGSGAADYGLLAVGDGILTAASAYPMVAPYREGAFDVSPPGRLGDLAYNGVARFEVTTTVPAGLRLVTNLVDQSPTPVAGGRESVKSVGTHVRDFVLVGGRGLERKRVKVGETDVTSVYLASDAEAGARALEAARVSLETFERRFGSYPYRELDVVEASLVGGAGGVEFSGMVLIAGMLYRPVDASKHPLYSMMKMLGGADGGGILGGLLGPKPGPAAGQAPGAPRDPMADVDETMKVALDFTVAHEVAHQYFAGLVGNDAHRFPSLDEPIAQFAAGLVMEELRGKEAAARAMDSNVKLNYATYRLLGGPDRAVLRDTTAFATPVEYAGLVYGKAPYLYVELRRKLGDEVLSRAIRKAVEKHRFEIVSTEAWISAIEKEAGGPSSGVRGVFDRYLKQTHGDKDLGVDDSGDFLFDTMMTPEMSALMKKSFGDMGMRPGDLMKMLTGGGL
jgi:hypothetical protein